MGKTAVEDLIYKSDGTLWWSKSGSGRNVNKPIGSKNCQGYLQCTLDRKQRKVHQVVWFIHNGYWPKSLDHINKDKTDNRIENLREGVSINNHNRDMPLPKSGIIGAHWNKARQKYKSCITLNGKQKHLGYFNCPTAASLAYLKEKEKVYA
jgi:hypothetical protein